MNYVKYYIKECDLLNEDRSPETIFMRYSTVCLKK